MLGLGDLIGPSCATATELWLCPGRIAHCFLGTTGSLGRDLMASLELEVVGGAGTSASYRPRLAGFTEVGKRRHFVGFPGGEQLIVERLNTISLLTNVFNYTSWEDRNRSDSRRNYVGRKCFFLFYSCVLFFHFKPTAVWFAVDYWQNWEESKKGFKTRNGMIKNVSEGFRCLFVSILSLCDINLRSAYLSKKDKLPVLNHCHYNEEYELRALV